MADNVTLNPGAAGAVLAAKEITHGGDTSQLQAVSLMGVTGSEGSYTAADINGDATNGLDVDVTRVIPGTSTTHLGKAIDTAAGATDTGVAHLAVRDDALGALTPVEGDYVALRTDANGALWVHDDALDAALAGSELQVDIVSSALPTGAATEATLANVLTSANFAAAFGTAGTADAQVMSIQGIASMTAVAVSAASLPLPSGAATSAEQATQTASLSVLDDWDDGTSPGRCRVLQAQDVALDGSTVETVKRFHVVTSTDGATVIAAVASRKFRIRSLSVFSTSTTVTNVWFEDADGADVFGDSTGIPVDADGGGGPAGFVLGYNPDGWFQTATVNKNLVVKLTAAQKIVIVGTYIEVA